MCCVFNVPLGALLVSANTLWVSFFVFLQNLFGLSQPPIFHLQIFQEWKIVSKANLARIEPSCEKATDILQNAGGCHCAYEHIIYHGSTIVLLGSVPSPGVSHCLSKLEYCLQIGNSLLFTLILITRAKHVLKETFSFCFRRKSLLRLSKKRRR